MKYTIRPSADSLYISLKVRGEITRERAMKLNAEAHALGRKLGINKYLVDVTQCRNVETTTNNYQFAYQDMAQADYIDKTARVATLVSPEDHSHDFIETVTKNSGLDNTLFRDRKLALEHLTKR